MVTPPLRLFALRTVEQPHNDQQCEAYAHDKPWRQINKPQKRLGQIFDRLDLCVERCAMHELANTD
jgi:hypothetical protein